MRDKKPKSRGPLTAHVGRSEVERGATAIYSPLSREMSSPLSPRGTIGFANDRLFTQFALKVKMANELAELLWELGKRLIC